MSDSPENVKVFCRIRPPNEREGGTFVKKCVTVPTTDPLQQTIQLQLRNIGVAPKIFTYDRVFDEHSSQQEIFEMVGIPLTKACLEGYNGTIFAYGQTGSGKTFTMQGPEDVLDSQVTERSNLRGLVPRVFDYLFKDTKESTIEHTFACSFLEIYNERVYDLLDRGSTRDSSGLQLRENGRKGVFVEGLIESIVQNAQQASELMSLGAQNRRVGQTAMNRESSRSHSVFILSIQSKESHADGIITTRHARFNLIDLAGSERQRTTETTGDRLKEAGSINKSLSALGNVIMGLVDQSAGKNRHVHYRDSKLTFLLKDSLGGNSKTFMIATISPTEESGHETLSTLKFAQRAKLIHNHAVINEDTSGNLLSLQVEIQRLRRQLQHVHTMEKPLENISEEHIELERAFASLVEEQERLKRSNEYLDVRNSRLQTLNEELKRMVGHLRLLRRSGQDVHGLFDPDASTDAIEWRLKYEALEESYLVLQQQVSTSPSDTSDVLLFTLTKQLAMMIREKHSLSDQLKQQKRDEQVMTLEQQLIQSQAQNRTLQSLTQAAEEQAQASSLEVLQSKQKETGWEIERESWSSKVNQLQVQVKQLDCIIADTQSAQVKMTQQTQETISQMEHMHMQQEMEFESKIIEMGSRNSELLVEVETTKSQCQELTTQLEHVTTTLKDEQQRNVSLMEGYEQNKLKWKEEVERLEQSLAQQCEETTRLGLVCSDREVSIQGLEEQVQLLEINSQQELEIRNQEQTRLEKVVRELTEQLSAREAAWVVERETLESNLETLQQAAQETEVRLASEKKVAQETEARLLSEKQEVVDALSALEEAKNILEVNLTSKLDAQKHTSEQLQQQLTTITTQCQEFQRMSKEAERTLRSSEESWVIHREELNSKINEIEGIMRMTQAALATEKQEAIANLSRLQHAKEVMQEKLESQVNDLEGIKLNLTAQLAQTQEELSTTISECSKFADLSKDLTQKLEILEASSQAECKDLTSKLAQAEEGARNTAAELMFEKQRASDELLKVQKEKDNITREFESRGHELSDVKTELTEVLEKLTRVSNERIHFEKLSEETTETLRSREVEWEMKRTGMESQIGDLQKTARDLETTLAVEKTRASDELCNLQLAKDEMEKKLSNDLRVCETFKLQLITRCEEVQQQLEDVRKARARVEKSLDESTETLRLREVEWMTEQTSLKSTISEIKRTLQANETERVAENQRALEEKIKLEKAIEVIELTARVLEAEKHELTTQAMKLKEQVEALTQAHGDAKKHCDVLEIKLCEQETTWNAERQEFELKLSKSQELIQKMESMLTEIKHNASEEQSSLRQANNMLKKEMETRIDGLETTKNELTLQCANLDEDLKIVTNKCVELKKVCEEVTNNLHGKEISWKAEREDFEKKLANLRDTLYLTECTLADEKERASLEYASQKQAHDANQEELRKVIASKNELSAQYSELQDQLTNITIERCDFETLSKELSQTLESIEAERLVERGAFESKTTELQNTLKATNAAFDRAREDLSQLQKAKETIEEEMKCVQCEITATRKELATWKHQASNDLSQLQQAKDATQAKLVSKTSELDKLVQRYRTVKEHLAFVKKERMDFETLMEQKLCSQQEAHMVERDEMESARAALQQELEHETDKLRRQRKKNESLHSQYDELSTSLREKSIRIEELEGEYRMTQQELDKSKVQLEIIRQELNEEKQRGLITLDDLKGITLKYEQATAQLDNLQASIDAHEENENTLQTKLAEVHVKTLELNEESKRLEIEKNSLTQQRQVSERIQREHAQYKTRVNELEVLKLQLTKDVEKYRQEVRGLTHRMENMSKENDKLVGHHNTRQKIQHHIKVKEENNRLIQQVRQLTDEKFKFESRIETLERTLKEKENLDTNPNKMINSELESSKKRIRTRVEMSALSAIAKSIDNEKKQLATLTSVASQYANSKQGAKVSLVDVAKEQQANDATELQGGTIPSKVLTLADVAKDAESHAPTKVSLVGIAHDINSEQDKRIEAALTKTAVTVKEEKTQERVAALKEAAAEIKKEEVDAAQVLQKNIEKAKANGTLYSSKPNETPIVKQSPVSAVKESEDDGDGYSSFEEDNNEVNDSKLEKKHNTREDDDNQSEAEREAPVKTIPSNAAQSKEFIRAVYHGDIRRVRDMMDEDGSELNSDTADQHGWSALHWAVAQGHTQLVELFLNQNVSINAVEHLSGWTPLHVAVVRERFPLIKKLLQGGADPMISDTYGDTAIECARGLKGKNKLRILQTIEQYRNSK